MSEQIKVFDQPGDFVAFDAAREWVQSLGYSVGSMQRDEPIGLMAGRWSISKWRSLSAKERDELDGTITGNKRNGPVTVMLKRDGAHDVKP